MKKITLLLSVATLFTSSVFAQVDSRKTAEDTDKKMSQDNSGVAEGWTKGGQLGINLNQSANSNWYTNPADKQIFSVSGTGVYKAYHRHGDKLWLNDFLLGYGVVNGNVTTLGETHKSDDRLLFSTTYAPKILAKNLYLAFNGDFSTQISKSLDYATGRIPTTGNYNVLSNFLTPGYIRAGVGLMYKPNKNFRIYFSPLTANITTKINNDNYFVSQDLFGVKANKKINFGLGALLRTDYQTMIGKNVTYKTRLDLFTDYLDRPFNKIDVDWLNTFSFNVTKFIGVNFNYNVRYHEAEINRVQRIDNLGVGFKYAF